MVGFLPAVREEILRANQPRQRPPLVIVEHPREVGPDGSVIVSDLRALLVVVVSEPPRLRQDHALFQKESERFLAPLEPLAPWLLPFLKWTDEGRLNQALAWARSLGLVHGVIEEKQHRLFLTPKGQRWLSGGLDEQYAAVYGLLISPGARHDMFEPHLRHFYPGLDPFSDRGPGDMRFLNEAPRPEAEVSGRPPRGGRFRAVAPRGGVHVGKAPLGPTRLLEVELSLTTLQLLLLADVLTHPGLVQAHRADTVARRPEV
jgi:hypothetical protein